MKVKVITSIVLALFLLGVLTAVFNVLPVKGAIGTIYIRADGTIDPLTAPIVNLDNITYVFTNDVNDFVVIEKGNIVVNGAYHTIQGNGTGVGLLLSNRHNVTIKKIKIKNFIYGIKLDMSSNNIISDSDITENQDGVVIKSSNYNSVLGNNITENWHDGILVGGSSDNKFVGNNIVGNMHGLNFGSSSNNNISRNNIEESVEGIVVAYSSCNSLFENNIASSNYDGILLMDSSDNILIGNNVTISMVNGISLHGSGNTLRNNNMANNTYNFAVSAESLGDFMNDVDTSNIVDRKRIYYWVNESNRTVPPDAGCVVLANCMNIIVRKLNLINNGKGVIVAYTSNSTITQNNIKQNSDGIWIFHSSNNSIVNNTIAANYHNAIELDSSNNNNIIGNSLTGNTFGIYLTKSSSNSIIHNRFNNNTIHVHDFAWDDPTASPSINTWDGGYPFGGNYWGNYVDKDKYSGRYQNETGSDGIWDHPYIIDKYNQDNYPIVSELPSPPSLPIIKLFIATLLVITGATVLVVIFHKRKQSRL